ncbi:MAG: hypothetical protein HY566_01635 [Candidatus Kerfeldbacteria bacterium]|nr:hypothetical protein [Candidatus Kerfeldbacteria bacterium]
MNLSALVVPPVPDLQRDKLRRTGKFAMILNMWRATWNDVRAWLLNTTEFFKIPEFVLEQFQLYGTSVSQDVQAA